MWRRLLARRRAVRSSFDVVHMGDLRFPGGTGAAIASEIEALAALGFRVGLIQKQATVLRAARDMNPLVRAQIERGAAELIEPGCVIESRLALLHNPYSFTDVELGLPRVRTAKALLVAHQAPLDGQGARNYDIGRIRCNLRALLGSEPAWAPISGASRQALREVLDDTGISDMDWPNLMVASRGPHASRPRGERPVIGRHSRPQALKWPDTLKEMLTIYPDDPAYDIRFLGAGEGLEALLAEHPVPENWTLHRFGDMPVAEFLSGIDIFVYFHHSKWSEAFGRTTAEAMSAGIPVILPRYMEATFGRAALYAEPAQVRKVIDDLWADPEAMLRQGALGREWISAHYGIEGYRRRVEALLR